MVPLDICFASASGKSEYEDFRKSWREYKSKHSYELQSSDITGTVRRFLSPEALKAVDHCISVTAGASRGLSYTAACINEEMIELQLFWYSEGGLGELKIEDSHLEYGSVDGAPRMKLWRHPPKLGIDLPAEPIFIHRQSVDKTVLFSLRGAHGYSLGGPVEPLPKLPPLPPPKKEMVSELHFTLETSGCLIELDKPAEFVEDSEHWIERQNGECSDCLVVKSHSLKLSSPGGGRNVFSVKVTTSLNEIEGRVKWVQETDKKEYDYSITIAGRTIFARIRTRQDTPIPFKVTA